MPAYQLEDLSRCDFCAEESKGVRHLLLPIRQLGAIEIGYAPSGRLVASHVRDLAGAYNDNCGSLFAPLLKGCACPHPFVLRSP